MRLVTICGTRPELIRLSCSMKKFDKFFDHIIVHTGQNWDKNLCDIFLNELEIRKPDYFLNVVGKNLGETVGNIISKTYDLFLELKPDCILILGDTNSAMCAYSAKRLKIPIFHIESGNRSFADEVPEEINRRIVDHISDINMCYTENSRRNLLREGIRSDYVFVIGSPMTEVILNFKNKINSSTILNQLGLEENKFFVLSLHREENIDNHDNFNNLMSALQNICLKYELPIIFSTHPRTLKRLENEKIVLNKLIKSMPPLGFFDYNKLQMSSLCVLSDSGSLGEESAILNFPCVSMRNTCERQEAIDKGNLILGNLKADSILNSIDIILKTHDKNNEIKPYDYMDTNISTKIVKIIQSYTDIINKTIWFKKI